MSLGEAVARVQARWGLGALKQRLGGTNLGAREREATLQGSECFGVETRWATPAFWREMNALLGRRVRLWGEEICIPEPTPWERDWRGDSGDVKFPWELGRLQFLPGLAVAAALDPPGPWARAACAWIDDFIGANRVGYGVQWRSPMEVALRTANMAIAWRWLSDAGFIAAPDADVRVARSLHDHARWVERHIEGPSPFASNHYVGNLYGLAVVACLHPDFRESRRWRGFAVLELEQEIARQVHPDGGHFEASTAYHRFVLEMFAISARLLELNGESLGRAFWARLDAMFEWALAMRQSDGSAPQIGDNDSGFAFSIGSRASLDWSRLEAFREWTFGARNAGSGTLQPAAVSNAGMFILKSSDIQITARAGSVGLAGKGSHAHNDQLSAVVFWGEPLLVDAGSYVYTGDLRERQRFRGTGMHNTVMIDNEEQNPIEPSLPFLMRERTHARCTEQTARHLVLEHLGYMPIVHRRTITLEEPLAVALSDEVLGKGIHAVVSSLHFAPSCSVERGTRAPLGWEEWVVSSPWRSWSVECRLPEGVRAETVPSWFSPEYGTRVATVALRMSGRVALPAMILVRIRA